MSSTKNLLAVALPIFKIWKYSGLPVYYVPQKCSYFAVGVLIIVVNVVVYMKFVGVQKTIYSSVCLLQMGSVFAQNIGLIFFTYKNKDNIESIFVDLASVERSLFLLSKKKLIFLKW